MSSAHIAIIIPVYNVEPWLPECLDSVQKQTHLNFTAFLVNDGSTDKSGNICDEYALRDNRFKVIHQQNSGVSSARNAALDEIEKDGSFDFIAFIDSDDFVSPDFLEKLVSAIEKNNADFSSCNTIKFRDGETPVLRKFFIPSEKLDKTGVLEQYLGLNQWRKYKSENKSLFNKLFSAKALYSVRFDKNLRIGEDVRYFAQIACNLHSGIVVDSPLYFYRIRQGSLTTSPHTVHPVPNVPAADKSVPSPDKTNPADHGIDTIRLFMAQAPENSDLYWSIHGQLIDLLWKRLKKAYAGGHPLEIDNCKTDLKKEMRPIKHLSVRHYRMMFLLALGDSVMRRYSSGNT